MVVQYATTSNDQTVNFYYIKWTQSAINYITLNVGLPVYPDGGVFNCVIKLVSMLINEYVFVGKIKLGPNSY